MSGIFVAHMGGMDEMAIILFPVVVGLAFWALTRQPNRPDKNDGAPPGA